MVRGAARCASLPAWHGGFAREGAGVDERGIPLSAAALGFEALAEPDTGWRKPIRGRAVIFRPLRRLADLLPVEALQREVMGVDERDLIPASELIVVPETGGEVLAAFLPRDGDQAAASPGAELAGAVVGWGGWVERRPRIVSDLLAVRAAHRNLGLGAELKKLQAAVALAAGFAEIVWTVDPLRAANARLNFEKLGAIADHYEENRYGDAFGAGLYGALPSDRLHVTWQIASDRVRHRLLGQPPSSPAAVAALPSYEPGVSAPRALVPLPADIDRLLAADPATALRWRLRLRATLQSAFADRYVISGFVPGVGAEPETSSYLIERR